MITLHLNKDKFKKEVADKCVSDKDFLHKNGLSKLEEKAVRQIIEARIEKNNFVKDETISEVLKNPLMTGYRQMFADMNFEELIKGSDKKKHHLNNLAILLGFAYTSIPHELIHAGTNKLLGGENLEIVINKFYDFGLSNYLIPGVESKFLFPIIGGYVLPDPAQLTDASFFAVSIAPYMMTSLGIYALQKGKEKKSLPLAVIGSGLTIGHAGGILGDFWNMGSIAVENTSEFVYTSLGGQNFNEFYNNFGLLASFAGFYAGWKAMNFTYRLSKAIVNKFRRKKVN